MDDKIFNELVRSIKDAGRFLRGESEPSRTFDTPDIKAIRQKTGNSQTIDSVKWHQEWQAQFVIFCLLWLILNERRL
ncbi:MAG: hypothetical protein ABFS56_08280 [Pseudomonadota bacterium]